MHFKKIKVNHMNDGYWLVPSIYKIFTPKISTYTTKFCKTFEELVQYNNFLNRNIVLNLNGDKNFYHFNKIMKMLNFNFEILNNKIEKMNVNEILVFQPLENLNIIFDFKAIKLIYSGLIPIFNLDYYQKLYQDYKNKTQQEKIEIVFRRFDFEIWKNK